jgi:hypothetical protein
MSENDNESSREASIVKESKNREDGLIEESMTITMDNFRIKTKRTSTPKRLLTSFS